MMTKKEGIFKNQKTNFVFISSKKRLISKWTKEEDNLLLRLTSSHDKKFDWKSISLYFENRTPPQCSSRYKRIHPGLNKGNWTKEEDYELMNLIKINGKNWSKISKIMTKRNCKQIRDRYLNSLDENIKKGKFTPEEDKQILELYKIHRNSWKTIASYFSSRTGDMIKK